MAYQPNLFSPEPADVSPARRDRSRSGQSSAGAHTDRDPANESGPDPGMPHQHHKARQQYSRWLARTELLVRVIVRLYLGLLITALPWMRFWTENGLLSFNQSSALFANNGFVRGMVSGLGMLNVAIALQELFFPRRP